MHVLWRSGTIRVSKPSVSFTLAFVFLLGVGTVLVRSVHQDAMEVVITFSNTADNVVLHLVCVTSLELALSIYSFIFVNYRPLIV